MAINPINSRFADVVYPAIAATTMACAALFSRFEAVKIVGLTVLAGVVCGTLSDLIACRECIEYFTWSHRYDGKELRLRLVNSLDPNLNALVWGMVVTWPFCAPGGVLLAIAARAPFSKFSSTITARQLAPYMGVGILPIVGGAHLRARAIQRRKMTKLDDAEYWDVPQTLQLLWIACRARNFTCYVGGAVGGAGLIIAVVASRSGWMRL